MFRAARLTLLNKIDLLSATPFDRARCLADIREVNPALSVIEVSATRGDGLDRWYAWLARGWPRSRSVLGRRDRDRALAQRARASHPPTAA